MAKTINGKIGRVIAHSGPPNVVLFQAIEPGRARVALFTAIPTTILAKPRWKLTRFRRAALGPAKRPGSVNRYQTLRTNPQDIYPLQRGSRAA